MSTYKIKPKLITGTSHSFVPWDAVRYLTRCSELKRPKWLTCLSGAAQVFLLAPPRASLRWTRAAELWRGGCWEPVSGAGRGSEAAGQTLISSSTGGAENSMFTAGTCRPSSGLSSADVRHPPSVWSSSSQQEVRLLFRLSLLRPLCPTQSVSLPSCRQNWN